MSARHSWLGRSFRTVLMGLIALIPLYALTAYFVLPGVWMHHEHQLGLSRLPMTARTVEGIPGDPLNIGLVGSRNDVIRAMLASGWFAADPITFRTSVEIIGSVVLDRPYRKAPVSPLFYLGRREDLAFEKPEGSSADRRHHVRLWNVLSTGAEGRPVWLGSVTFDISVGFSHLTGAFTHHIAPDVDRERQSMSRSLEAAGMVEATYNVSGVGPTLFGRNGEGDRYFTDGEIQICVLVVDGKVRKEPPVSILSPAAISFKDQAFRMIAPSE
jgi:LssY C-terminus